MCGIAGIMSLQRRPCDVYRTQEIVRHMTELIAHRGPDGEGHLAVDEGHVFLGHRRLAVIDLSDKAKQDRQAVEEALAGGASLEDACAKYISEQAFREWYESFSSELKKVIEQ